MTIKSKTALLSVYEKKGIAEFASELKKLGWRILASGGTAKHLKEAGIEAEDIASMAGEPILGHRVVSLSREIHAGLLAKNEPEHIEELARRGIPWIDLVCVDLYPLEEEIKKQNATRPHTKDFGAGARESVVEMTDIGGPAIIRSAAKGGRIVVCDPADRQKVIEWLKTGASDEARLNDAVGQAFVRSLAAKGEFTVAQYVFASASYIGEGMYAGIAGERAAECLYGENAWQTPAGLYSPGSDDPLALENFRLVEGTAPSYNNWCDLDRLLQTITHAAAGLEANGGLEKFPYIAVAVKHGNPCGAAYGADPEEVLKKTILGDPLAIMGGAVIANFEISGKEAEVLSGFGMDPPGQAGRAGNGRRILDAVAAPAFSSGAVELLRRKKDKCRFLANDHLGDLGTESLDRAKRFRYVRGGFLNQPNYDFVLNLKDASIQRFGNGNFRSSQDLRSCDDLKLDLVFAWAIGSTSSSNTITLVKDRMLIGDGVGQQDRVGAAKLAIERARRSGHDPRGAVAYSDSFFPFPDGPQVLVDAGVGAILTTSGSINDKDTIDFCEKKAVALFMIPDKLGRGFFGH